MELLLAREFTHSRFRVILFAESRRRPARSRTRRICTPAAISDDLYDLFPASRLRYFGGTTNHWGGVWCDLPASLSSMLKRVRLSRIPAGRSRCPISSRGIGARSRSSNWVLTVMNFPIGASRRAMFPSRSAARISFAEYYSKAPLRGFGPEYSSELRKSTES